MEFMGGGVGELDGREEGGGDGVDGDVAKGDERGLRARRRGLSRTTSNRLC